MGTTPKVDKPKYNNNKPYEWVDSQWEKFMSEQIVLKARIKELESQVVTLEEEKQELESELYYTKRNRKMEEIVNSKSTILWGSPPEE